MQKQVLIQLAVIILIAVFLNACKQPQTTSTVEQPSASPVIPIERGSDNQAIRFLEDRIKRNPDDFIANNKLVSEYLQLLRETGNITYLNLADRAANASLASLPAEQNKGGLIALTQVEFSLHKFAAARDHAKRLSELDPNKGYPYQFLGDALLELGQYDEAEKAFQKMDELGGIRDMTKVAIDQRLARVALLHGDNKKAAMYFSLALKTASAMPEPPKETIAWCQWQLGDTAFAGGEYEAAEKYYRQSLETFPDYFRSLAALGRVRAARGDMNEAIGLYEKVVKILPDPGFIASLGDLYKLAGREQEAQDQYALVEKIGQLTAAGTAVYSRQLALFYADHDLKPEEAYQSAAKEYEVRRDIYGADALAWTALKAGKTAEAKTAITEALKLGTKDAKIYYHAGMIEKALGNTAEAKRFLGLCLKTSPGFDPLQAVEVRKALGA